MDKKVYITAVLLVALSFSMAACGKKESGEKKENLSPKQQVSAPVEPGITPQVSEEEAEKMADEQKAIVQQAEVQEQQAQKEVAKKVVTSSVAESVPIPDGFPVQNVPIIQGAQIVSASKEGNTYHMVLRVNISSQDAYKHYFDLYDATGSVRIVAQSAGKSLSIERTKSGLTTDFAFADENEGASKITMKVAEAN